jgi:hypothetical protein
MDERKEIEGDNWQEYQDALEAEAAERDEANAGAPWNNGDWYENLPLVDDDDEAAREFWRESRE